MKTKIVIAIAGTLALTSVVLVIPTFAQTTNRNYTATASSTRARRMPGTSGMMNRFGQGATSTATRITNMQNSGNKEIDSRVQNLNKLLTRVQDFKKVSDTDKSGIVSSIQSEIATMTNLKNKIDADNSTTTLRGDVQSITKEYRIYALVIPRVNIIAAADRIGTIADMLTSIASKLETRLATTTSISNLSSLQASLTDMKSKIADAKTQAAAAASEVSSLQPDNGDQNILKTNTATLKDARTKIQTANADLVTARKDSQTIIKSLRGTAASPVSATSTENH